MLLVVILLVMSSMLSACSSGGGAGGTSSEPVTIRILGSAGWPEELTKKYAAELEKQNIKIEAEFYDWVTYDGKQKLAMTSQGGDYDIVFLPGNYVNLWAGAEAILPMDDFMKEYGYSDDDYYDSVKKYGKVDGKWYMVPISAEAMVYFYRKDLYDAAGLQPPKTIEEMYETGKKLTKDGVYGVAYPGGPEEGSSSFWSYFLWSFGGTYYDEQWNPQLNTPEAVASAEMFAKILNETAPEGVATWQNEETVAAFSAGNIASMIMWPGYYGTLADKEKSKVAETMAIAPVPVGPSGKAVPRFGAWGLSVTNNAKDKMDAVNQFIHMFTNKDGLKSIAAYTCTPSISVNSDPELRKANPTLGPSADVLNTADERPPIPESAQINPLVGNAINSIVAGKPAKPTLDDVQKQVEEIMKEAGYIK